MRKIKGSKIIRILFVFYALVMFNQQEASAADNPCAAVKAGTKVMWGKEAIKPYQVGRVTFLKKTILYKIDGSKKITVRTARAGEKIPVYAIQTSQLDLGNGLFVARDQKVKLEKATTRQRQLAVCVHEMNLEKAAGQMIVVKTSTRDKTKAILQRYEKKNGKWVKISSPMQAIVGKKGVGKTKEGDSLTPRGTYLLGTSFGWGTKPSGIKYPFRKATKTDYWVDYSKSKDYNKWVQYNGNPTWKWKSYERLTHPLYKYAVVIRYNDDPVINGAGSAIFLHIKNKSTRYTLGCTAISENDLLKVIKWLNPKSKPIIKIEG
ncbi:MULTISPECIES: L,D-transpeptidase [unclassified Bacillus (in: firmicutes)]|uniref:L,D-transpeptidase family protein n=1 Tax=unclassified Bacillus (in: firmicutes) TaxID=185979 RepID=UPI002035FF3E|nr:MULTISPECIES: L,D-transpeptidase family protein [unclassified Bacillus (in: firmicutes)]